MKIAMPYQDGVLLEHFGRAKEFIIYNVSDLDPVTHKILCGAKARLPLKKSPAAGTGREPDEKAGAGL